MIKYLLGATMTPHDSLCQKLPDHLLLCKDADCEMSTCAFKEQDVLPMMQASIKWQFISVPFISL